VDREGWWPSEIVFRQPSRVPLLLPSSSRAFSITRQVAPLARAVHVIATHAVSFRVPQRRVLHGEGRVGDFGDIFDREG